MTRDEALGLLAAIGAAWPNGDMNDATIEVWVEHMDKIHPDDGYKAVYALAEESKFLPSIHELIDRSASFAALRRRDEQNERGLPAPACPFGCDSRGWVSYEKQEKDGRMTFWAERCKCGGSGYRDDPKDPETTPEQAKENIARLREMLKNAKPIVRRLDDVLAEHDAKDAAEARKAPPSYPTKPKTRGRFSDALKARES